MIKEFEKLADLAKKPQAKTDSSTQDTKKPKEKVYVLSNSLPVSPIFNPEDNDEVIALKTRPGGLGTGVRPGFSKDSSFEIAGWLGLNKQLMTVNNTVNEDDGSIDDNLIVNESKQHNLNLLLDKEEKMEFVFMDEEIIKQFYGGASNEIFWPLDHGIHEHVKNEDEDILSGVYASVNELMAEKMIEKIQNDNNGKVPDDTMVWVQDYHFQLNSKYLKEKAPQLKVGYVHHIPFPEVNEELIKKFPKLENLLKDSITGMLYADTISFHTQEYKNNFLKSVKNMGIITDDKELAKVESKIIVNPIGIPKHQVINRLIKTVYNHSGRKEKSDRLARQREVILPVFEKAYQDNQSAEELYNNLITALNENGNNEPLNDKKIAELKEVIKIFIDSSQNHSAEVFKEKRDEVIRDVGVITHDLLSYSNLDSIWEKDLLPKIKAKNEASIEKNKKIDNASTEKERKEKKDSLVKGVVKIDPNKINIGAVSRLDYTKGIHELLDGYYKFLKDKRGAGVQNPEEKYQLNIVASTPRDIPAYAEYQRVVDEKMDAILKEFPGSLTYIPGIDFDDLGLHNAVNDITIATSIKDGYLMAAAEAILVRDFVVRESANLLEDKHKPSALIISKGAGISESLSKSSETGKHDIPEVLSVVETNKECIAEAIYTQTKRIEKERLLPKKEQKPNLDAFSELIERINTAEYSAKRGLDFLKDKSEVHIELDNGTSINSKSNLRFHRFQSTVTLSTQNLSERNDRVPQEICSKVPKKSKNRRYQSV